FCSRRRWPASHGYIAVRYSSARTPCTIVSGSANREGRGLHIAKVDACRLVPQRPTNSKHHHSVRAQWLPRWSPTSCFLSHKLPQCCAELASPFKCVGSQV